MTFAPAPVTANKAARSAGFAFSASRSFRNRELAEGFCGSLAHTDATPVNTISNAKQNADLLIGQTPCFRINREPRPGSPNMPRFYPLALEKLLSRKYPLNSRLDG